MQWFRLEAAGLCCPAWGVGSTPSCSHQTDGLSSLTEVGSFEMLFKCSFGKKSNLDLTQIHPGAYVFYDAQQTGLGSCLPSEVAAKVKQSNLRAWYFLQYEYQFDDVECWLSINTFICGCWPGYLHTLHIFTPIYICRCWPGFLAITQRDASCWLTLGSLPWPSRGGVVRLFFKWRYM